MAKLLVHLAIFLFVQQVFLGTDNFLAHLLFFPFLLLGFFVYKKTPSYFKIDDLSKKSCTILAIILLLLISIRSGQVIRKVNQENIKTEDIARVYHDSINLLFEQKNPYNSPIDYYHDIPLSKDRIESYSSAKYPPLQMFLYAPFVYLKGLNGIYVGNLFPYVGMLVLILFFGNFKTKESKYFATILYLGTDFIFYKAFNKGTNDFWPTFFLLLTIIYINQNKLQKSGIYLALSLLSKQFPAAIIAYMLLLQKKLSPVIIATICFFIGILPFFVWEPVSFYKNVVEFNLIRPARPTSFLYWMPNILQAAIPLFAIIIIGVLTRYFKDIFSWGKICFVLLLFISTSKMSPGNYYIWLFPFSILWYVELLTIHQSKKERLS